MHPFRKSYICRIWSIHFTVIEKIKKELQEISRLKIENERISETLDETKAHLKRYTAPAKRKE